MYLFDKQCALYLGVLLLKLAGLGWCTELNALSGNAAWAVVRQGNYTGDRSYVIPVKHKCCFREHYPECCHDSFGSALSTILYTRMFTIPLIYLSFNASSAISSQVHIP